MLNQYSTITPYTERFFKYIGRKTTTGCIPWTGATTKGCGVIGRGGKGAGNVYASRVAYEIAFGCVPDGMVVCHHCDNPICVNPSHLFVGTQADNLADMRAKGRGCAGEKYPGSILTKDKILSIHAALAAKESQRSIARRFGVCQQLISDISRGKKWKHVVRP